MYMYMETQGTVVGVENANNPGCGFKPIQNALACTSTDDHSHIKVQVYCDTTFSIKSFVMYYF